MQHFLHVCFPRLPQTHHQQQQLLLQFSCIMTCLQTCYTNHTLRLLQLHDQWWQNWLHHFSNRLQWLAQHATHQTWSHLRAREEISALSIIYLLLEDKQTDFPQLRLPQDYPWSPMNILCANQNTSHFLFEKTICAQFSQSCWVPELRSERQTHTPTPGGHRPSHAHANILTSRIQCFLFTI